MSVGGTIAFAIPAFRRQRRLWWHNSYDLNSFSSATKEALEAVFCPHLQHWLTCTANVTDSTGASTPSPTPFQQAPTPSEEWVTVWNFEVISIFDCVGDGSCANAFPQAHEVVDKAQSSLLGDVQIELLTTSIEDTISRDPMVSNEFITVFPGSTITLEIIPVELTTPDSSTSGTVCRTRYFEGITYNAGDAVSAEISNTTSYNYECAHDLNPSLCGSSGYGPGESGEFFSWNRLDQCFVRGFVSSFAVVCTIVCTLTHCAFSRDLAWEIC